MISILSLIFLIIGTILLGLDRILVKEHLIKFDKRLSAFVSGYRIKGIVSFMLWIILVLSVFLRTYFIGKLIGNYLLVLSLILMLIIASMMTAYQFYEDERIECTDKLDEPKRLYMRYLTISLFAWIFLFIAFPLYIIDWLLKIALSIFIYPLKGILFFNNRYFNSFSGIIGLLLVIVSAILQFVK